MNVKDKQILDSLIDELCDDIVDMPDDLLHKKLSFEGVDIKNESKSVASIIEQCIDKRDRTIPSLYEATKNAFKEFKQGKKRIILPETSEERRSLLSEIMKGDYSLSNDLTLAFREESELSDDDVTGILEDILHLDNSSNG